MKEQKNILKESIYKRADKAIKEHLAKLTEDLNSEIDKELWCDNCEEELDSTPAQEPTIDNSSIIHVDKPEECEEDEEPESAADFIMKAQGVEPEQPKPEQPAVLSEFDNLSNEEKKELLLQLAKNDNDLNAILSAYLNKKVEQ